MKSKRKTLLSRAPSVLIALIIASGGLMKLVSLPQLVDLYSKIGLLPYLHVLGLTELLFAALFLWDRTLKAGLLLLTGYFGGAIAVELSHGSLFVAPATILSVAWIAAYLRDASIFKYQKQVRQPSNPSSI